MKMIYNLKFKKQRGFTLVELTLYMGILTILVTALSAVFVSIIDSQLAAESTSSIDQDGRYILAKLTYDMAHAQSIDSPASPSAQTSSSLQLHLNSIIYTYSLDGSGGLQLASPSATNTLNSVNASISALTFQRLGNNDSNDTVQVKFTVTGRTRTKSGFESQNFQTTLGLQ